MQNLRYECLKFHAKFEVSLFHGKGEILFGFHTVPNIHSESYPYRDNIKINK